MTATLILFVILFVFSVKFRWAIICILINVVGWSVIALPLLVWWIRKKISKKFGGVIKKK